MKKPINTTTYHAMRFEIESENPPQGIATVINCLNRLSDDLNQRLAILDQRLAALEARK